MLYFRTENKPVSFLGSRNYQESTSNKGHTIYDATVLP